MSSKSHDVHRPGVPTAVREKQVQQDDLLGATRTDDFSRRGVIHLTAKVVSTVSFGLAPVGS